MSFKITHTQHASTSDLTRATEHTTSQLGLLPLGHSTAKVAVYTYGQARHSFTRSSFARTNIGSVMSANTLMRIVEKAFIGVNGGSVDLREQEKRQCRNTGDTKKYIPIYIQGRSFDTVYSIKW